MNIYEHVALVHTSVHMLPLPSLQFLDTGGNAERGVAAAPSETRETTTSTAGERGLERALEYAEKTEDISV